MWVFPSTRPQNQIDWHCPGYHWVLRLPTRPSAGCSSPTRSPSCSSPMFQLLTLKPQCHTSFKPQCHNLFIFSLLSCSCSCSWKNAVFIHIWPNIVRHCLGPNEEQQSSFSGVLLLARSSYSSPPKIDIDILFSSWHRQGLDIMFTQTFDLSSHLLTSTCWSSTLFPSLSSILTRLWAFAPRTYSEKSWPYLEGSPQPPDHLQDPYHHPPQPDQPNQLTCICIIICQQTNTTDIANLLITTLPSLINPHTYSRAVQLAATLGPRYLDYQRWQHKWWVPISWL